MNDQNSVLVDCREIEVVRAEGPFGRGSVWGDPIHDAAVAALRRVYGDRDAARSLGLHAAETVRTRLSVEAVAAQAARLLSGGGLDDASGKGLNPESPSVSVS